MAVKTFVTGFPRIGKKRELILKDKFLQPNWKRQRQAYANTVGKNRSRLELILFHPMTFLFMTMCSMQPLPLALFHKDTRL